MASQSYLQDLEGDLHLGRQSRAKRREIMRKKEICGSSSNETLFNANQSGNIQEKFNGTIIGTNSVCGDQLINPICSPRVPLSCISNNLSIIESNPIVSQNNAKKSRILKKKTVERPKKITSHTLPTNQFNSTSSCSPPDMANRMVRNNVEINFQDSMTPVQSKKRCRETPRKGKAPELLHCNRIPLDIVGRNIDETPLTAESICKNLLSSAARAKRLSIMREKHLYSCNQKENRQPVTGSKRKQRSLVSNIVTNPVDGTINVMKSVLGDQTMNLICSPRVPFSCIANNLPTIGTTPIVNHNNVKKPKNLGKRTDIANFMARSNVEINLQDSITSSKCNKRYRETSRKGKVPEASYANIVTADLVDQNNDEPLLSAESTCKKLSSAVVRAKRLRIMKEKKSSYCNEKDNRAPRIRATKKQRPVVRKNVTKSGTGSTNRCKRLNRKSTTKGSGRKNTLDIYTSGENQEPVDHGNADYTCPLCQASMWYNEKSDNIKKTRTPTFSLCCLKGKVVLPLLRKPPPGLFALLKGNDRRSQHFADNIRAYNNMFSFTSIGGKVISSMNNGSGPPQFILSGQNYHRIGSLLPLEGERPKFAQLYIYDTHHENHNRMSHFSASKKGESLDISIVEDLKNIMDEHNQLAKSFRLVRDFINANPSVELKLRLLRGRGKDPRTYNLPTCDEIAAVIVGDFENENAARDIIVKNTDGGLERIHETHTAFIPLQYPLLFPYGEDGFQENILYSEAYLANDDISRKRVTLREFIAFRIQDRKVEHGKIIFGRRLFQQFVVDTFTMVEAQRLSFIKNNQNVIRTDFLNGVQEAINRGETESSSIGMRIILPSSFTGGRRYMFNNCQDAMAVCKKFGYPDLFITCTCNSSWPEIANYVKPRNLRPDERPDICCRVFKIKLDNLIADLRKGLIFGPVDAAMYTIEFQKRGLPHAHILLWLKKKNKISSADEIDKFISAELPDPLKFPKLYKNVTSFMIHGPCGLAFPTSPCMENSKCSKHFPKKFQLSTTIDEDGYPVYRRRDHGITVVKKSVSLDNGYVVPYNPTLLMRYQGHINVEYCNKSNSIKYLFKYVSKGPDRVNINITNDYSGGDAIEVKDEIKQYYDCRYLTPCEGAWRIFAFDINYRWPPVGRLNFHLPNQQRVLFRDDEDLEELIQKPSVQRTMFISWMEANKIFEQGKGLSYAEFPTKFVFHKKSQNWRPRKKGFSIGRLQFIPPGIGELYYLRILLTVQKGCTSFEDIRTVHGTVHTSFHDACYALGLLADDREYIEAIFEANDLGSGAQLRKLFVTLLMSNTMAKPEKVWEKTWELLADGIVFSARRNLQIPGLQISDSELINLCLVEVEKLLQLNGRSLKEFDQIPYPDMAGSSHLENRFVADELNYDKQEMKLLHTKLVASLTSEQRSVYEQIYTSVLSNKGGLYFLYGFGGTGKTYIWNTLSAAIRGDGLIVLNVASSGIASLLLPGGRTAHSRFSIPISVNECSTCNIKLGSHRAELLQKTHLIIWDEAPMLNKLCFEALDRTMNDIMKLNNNGESYVPFGGKVVVLGGDFRQILPVIKKGCRSEIVASAINSSFLWKHCKVLKLTTNMRLLNTNPDVSVGNETREFAEWILRVGDDKFNEDGESASDIEIPTDLLVTDSDNPIESLISFTYPLMLPELEQKNFSYFDERAILAPTLESVEHVNNLLLSSIPGDEKEYLSVDSPCMSDEDSDIQGQWLTTEFLNEIKCSGIPNHRIILKVGVPIMLLRNIDQSGGLCNGTRLIVSDLGKNVIGAKPVAGSKNRQKVFIPRMSLILSDAGIPFKFQRRQFPVSLCFAMTINKSQGQSLSHVGLYLPKPVFTHGQLYVALSRVKSRKGLKILILNEDGSIASNTKNVVYTEVFGNL